MMISGLLPKLHHKYFQHHYILITSNVENSPQYKSRFSLIVEQILAFTWSTNSVREVKKLGPSFKRIV